MLSAIKKQNERQMSRKFLAVCAVAALSACSQSGGILPEGAVEVTENRVNDYPSPDGALYDMRTYVVQFEKPYYITVAPAGRTFAFEHERNSAGRAAGAYIQSRGCTGPISRLSRQDVYSPSDQTWTIVISC